MLLGYDRWKSASGESSQPSAKQRIVLLHGMGGTGSLWRPIAANLEEEFDVLAPDQRGHGRSRVTTLQAGRSAPDYTPLAYGRDVVETLDSLSFFPAWIVGHSMGVRTACAAAHLRPNGFRGLVLIDLGFSGVAGGGLGDGLALFLRKLPVRFASREEARAFMATECPDPSIAQYLMAVSVRESNGQVTFPFDSGALIQTITAARDASVRTWVRELGTRGLPILVLRGARSLVWTQDAYEDERRQFADLPSVQFEEFADAGHGLPFEKRAAFVERLKGWIASHS